MVKSLNHEIDITENLNIYINIHDITTILYLQTKEEVAYRNLITPKRYLILC